MDRRKFLGKAALATIPVVLTNQVSAQAKDLPASLTGGMMSTPKDGLLTLPINDAFPSSLRSLTQSLTTLFIRLNSDPTLIEALAKDPGLVLKEYGLNKFVDARDPLVDVLKLSIDPELIKLVKKSDYNSFMEALREKGLLKDLSKSKLRQHYYKAFSQDQENFNKYLKQIFDTNPRGIASSHVRSQRINRIIDLMQDGTDQTAFSAPTYARDGEGESPEMGVVGAFALAVVAVVAATYVVAVVNVAAAVNIGSIVSVVTRLAIWGWEEPARIDALGAVDQSDKVVAARINNLQIASMAANLGGRNDLALDVVKSTITEDLDAMVSAAEQAGLLTLPKVQREAIMFELHKLCLESVGILE